MSAIYILWLRQLKRYTRSRVQIIASLGHSTTCLPVDFADWWRDTANTIRAQL